MNKQFIVIPGLFALGILTGIVVMNSRDKPDSSEPVALSTVVAEQVDNPFVVVEASDDPRFRLLEEEIAVLKSRIEQLEASLNTDDLSGKPSQAVIEAHKLMGDAPIIGSTRVLTAVNLVKAGIDADLAEDIVRRKNEIELKKLELRDSASREGYLGTMRYMNELEALSEQEVSIRDEIGDDAYDRYLFASGQSNRIRVVSVMVGSAAETAGMKNGDLILSYGEQPMFEWSELQNASTQGTRDEYISVTVFRNGQLTNLWMPRGPLGVRLGSTRVKP